MGISAVCANSKTSLMHACKAGVIHWLMCPQSPWLAQHNQCMARRTGREDERKADFLFLLRAAAKVITFLMLVYAEMTLSKM